MRTRPDPRPRRPSGPRRSITPPHHHGTSTLTHDRMREVATRPAFRPQRGGHGNLLTLGIVIGILLAVALSSTVLQSVYTGRIYPRVTVDGYALEGLTTPQAMALLQTMEGKQTLNTLTLQGNGHLWTVRPADFGTTYDVQAAVRAAYAVGRAGNWFQRLLNQARAVFQGTSIGMHGHYDRQRLQSYVSSLAPAMTIDPQPAVVGPSQGGIAILREPRSGQKLDTARATAAVGTALDSGRVQTLTLPIVVVESAINHAVAQAAVDSTHNLLAGPVTFTYANAPQPWVLNSDGLARLLTFSPAHDHAGWLLHADVDKIKLARTLRGVARAIAKPAHDATYIVAGDYVTVAPDLPGSALDIGATARQILALANGQGSRTIYLPTHAMAATFDAARARALDFNARMAFGTASWQAVADGAEATLAHNQAHNVALAVNHLNNLRLDPGAVFTFTQAVGPINARGDYYPGLNKLGPGDVSGQGGGVTQVASALYQAAYLGGLGIARRDPPLSYSTLYGMLPGQIGLDALAYSAVKAPDLVITNTTTHPVLIMADFSDADRLLHVYLYNTRGALPDVHVQNPSVVTHPDGRVDVSYSRAIGGANGQPAGNDAITHYRPLEDP